MEDQDELIICKSDGEEEGLEANNNNKAALEDIGHNAANQGYNSTQN